MIAQTPENEIERLKALQEYDILDTLSEAEFDDITKLASHICEAPIALISLIDENRQWFKSKVGLNVSETNRDYAFCSHAILQNDIFEVKDAIIDPSFKENPLVVNDPRIRFYAGMPLTNRDGFNLGTLCVIDQKPRVLTELHRQNLKILAKQVTALIEARRYKKTIDALNQKLNEQLTFFSSIINQVPAMIAVWDKHLICQFANDEYLDLVNQPQAKVIGQHYDHIVPDAAIKITKPYAARALDGEFCQFELMISKDRLGLCKYKPFFDDNYVVKGFFVVITDIGILKKAQQNARLLTSIFDQTSDAIVITDQNHHILNINRGFTKMYGYQKAEILGKKPDFLIPNHSKEHDSLRVDQKIIDHHINLEGHVTNEIWQKTKNGNLIFCRVSVHAIKNEFNKIVFHVATSIDLTESQKNKTELQLAKDMLDRTSKMSKVGGWEYAFKSGEIKWSNQCFNIHEIETNVVPFLEDALSYYQPEARSVIQAAIQKCIETGEPYNLELPLITAKKNRIWVQTTGELIKENGKAIKLAGTIQDITEKKAQELQKIEHEINLRNTLVREVHHRIKNNLQGVSGILSHHAVQNPTINEPLNQANAQLQSVAIIYGLQGKSADNKIELGQLVSAISQNIASLWNTKIELNMEEDWKPVTISEKETVPLALVINELITNAVKHQSLPDSVAITLKFQSVVNSIKTALKDKAIISICNHGQYKIKEQCENSASAINNTGLNLVQSLLPKNGAYLCWYFEENKVSVILELKYPVVTF